MNCLFRFRRFGNLILSLTILVTLVSGSLLTGQPPAATPPLILISLDGFRWDYCDKYPAETPNLRRLMAQGVTARRLTPVFPSNTFPNHYSLVTGLYPTHHGMVNNDMLDASTGEVFHYRNAVANRNPRWWGGEPIWITAIRQGLKSACYFWVGSEAELQGIRPTFWYPYNYSVPFAQRLDTVIAWLRLPANERPAIVAFYLEETNSAGHTFGPDSPELAAAVKLLDGRVGTMVARLESEKIAANLVIVSDHGMTGCDAERVVVLDDYIDPATVQIDFTGPVTGLRAPDGDTSALVARLASMPHARVLRTADLPAEFNVSPTPRTPAVWILSDEGWHVQRRAEFERYRSRYLKGDHGYDPTLESMGAVFIAQGPSFKSGVTIGAVENIHVYNLLCAALGLVPAPNDGDDRLVRAVLRD
jgi:predicted AlkP superfamily pyrophosphatase or phosphodiesterase